jgi:hypothetical protein
MALTNLLLTLLERVYQESYEGKGKEIIKIRIAAASRSVDECCQSWRSELNRKDKEKVANHLREFNQQVLLKSTDQVTAISICLGLLSDLASHIKEPTKKRAIDKLENALLELHNFFDSPLDQAEAYREADRAIKLWYQFAN